MKTEFPSNLLSASSLPICFAGRKFPSQKIQIIYALTISLLVLSVNVNFAQQGRNFQSVKENQITKSKLQKTTDANGEVEQEWVAIYNGTGNLSDEATDIAVDSLGNVYVTGHSQGPTGNYDCGTIKYNTHGEVQWINKYDGGFDDYAYKLALDDSGNVFITGSSFGSGSDEDCLTIKYNSDGVEQWLRKYNGPGNGDDSANDIVIDDTGNVFVTGESFGLGTQKDYLTIKYNPLGIEQWVKRFNGSENSYDEAVAIGLDNTGNVLVTGRSIGLNNHFNYLTVKYNNVGIQQWFRRYDGPGIDDDLVYDMAVDDSGYIYVTGKSSDISMNRNCITIKYNPNGDEEWITSYDGPTNGWDEGHAISVSVSGNVYVTGISADSGGYYDYITVKYNQDGIEQWVNRYNGSLNGIDWAFDLILDVSENVYVTGVSANIISPDYTTIKYDSSGTEQWIVIYDSPSSGLDQATAIELDSLGNVYVTGISSVPGPIVTFNYATVKYVQSIVPVELIFFNALVNHSLVELKWQTSSETNNLGFEIERNSLSNKLDKGWKKIGFVQGRGTTTEFNSYSFIDKQITSGLYFYRLKQIDFNGAYKYWPDFSGIEVNVTLSLEFMLEQNFPNPFNSITNINYSIAKPSHVVLKVYNSLGEKVSILVNEEKEAGRYSLMFDARDLSSGVYFYQLNASGASGEYNFIKKFVLLK